MEYREAYEFCIMMFRTRHTIYWLRAARRVRARWANKVFFVA